MVSAREESPEAPSRSRKAPPESAGGVAHIRVLGPVEVTGTKGRGHLGGPKQRAVFAMLVARLGSVVTTDELVDGIWGEDPPIAVLSSLHTYVSNLRANVGHPIERHGSGYRLEAERSGVDGYLFEDGVDTARREAVTNPTAAGERLRRALALWRGRAYADVAFFPGLANEAVRLEELRLSAVESRIEADLALGRHAALIGELDALAAEYPLRESLRAKHMLALYRDGRQADALRAFRRTREYLRDELGLDPSPELQELEVRILNHDYTLIQSREVVNERLALLFTEIVDSSGLWEVHPAEMQVARAHHDDILRTAIDQAGGTVVKPLADGFIAAFSDPALAVRAAVGAQHAVLNRDWTPLSLNVRMAVDSGEVERRGGDLFGPAMNRGARLVSAAHGGQILLSVDAQRELGRDPGTQVKSLGELRFKGLGTAQAVFQLVVQGLPAEFPPPSTFSASVELDRQFGDAVRGYELRELVGRGAFANVYRAYQSQVGREVAIKIFRPEFAGHPAFVRRFESDARFAASLAHPHIVPLYDYWRDADGAYLVSPFMAGGDLADQARADVPLDRALSIVGQVGSALSYAHRQGILHRNVKPANVLLDGDGNAYLGDFGAAGRAVEVAVGAPTAASAYRAAEDLDGATGDARSDIFSLAAVIGWILTATTPDALELSRLDPRLRAAIDQGLATNPEDRPGSVDEFLELLAAATGAAPPARASRAFRNPYKGLSAFQEPDGPDFFGRADEVRRALAMIAEHRLSAVVGPSGSGKSSLVLAGVQPSIRGGPNQGSENWVSVHATPGPHPFDELAVALAALSTDAPGDLASDLTASDARGLLRVAERIGRELDTELLLIVDQFEELFTLVASDETRDRFVLSLTEAAANPASRIRIVLTLRADFFHEALSLPILGPIVSGAHLALAPLDPDATHEAIVEPAARAGLELEPGLADRIITDLAGQPGSLPLLQFTLDRLAAASTDGRLSHAGYELLGGVRGAIAERAEAAYRSLTDPQRDVARHVFTRLVTVSDDANDLRRRVRVSEFRSLGLPEVDVTAVLDTFGRERLLTFDVDPTTRTATVEVAHEALLREWGRLRGWIESAWEDVKLHRRLASAVADWENAGRDASFLLRGSRLDQFEGWARTSGMALTEAERGYLAESRAAQRAEQAEEEARQAREAALEHRSLVRLRALLAVFVIAAILASGLAFAALEQEQRARQQTLLASARELAAAAVANLELDPELSMLLALEAVEVTAANGGAVLPETEEALHRALLASRIVDTLSDVGTAVDWGTTGLLAFAGGWETGAVELRDAVSRETTGRWQAHESAINDIEFSTDGSLLATAADDGSVRLWKTSGGGLVRALEGPAGRVWGISFSADDRLLAAQWWDGTASVVLVWDVGKGEVVRTVAGLERDQAGRQTTYAASGTALSGDGSLLAISLTSRPSLELHDVHGGQLIARLPDEPFLFNVNGVAWQRGASLVASINQEATVSLWDAASGELHDTLFGHTAAVNGGDWSADGSRLVTASVDGTARVWEVTPAGGRLLLTLAGHGTGLVDAGFAPDGNQVVTLDTRGTAKIWDVGATGDAEWMNLPAEPRWFGAVAFTPDGGLLLGSGAEGTLSVFDAANGKKVRTLSAHGQVAGPGWGPRVNGGVASVGVSPDGRLVATGGRDNLVRVWSLPEGDEIYTFSGHDADAENWIEAVRFSPDGTLLASGSMDGTVRILEAATGREVQRLAHDGAVLAVRFLADGRTLVSGSWDGNMRVWDLDASTASLVIPVGEQINGLDVNPEETRVAAVTFQGTAAVWDVRTGERLLTLAGHSGPIKAVAYNPDGSLLATGSEDGEIRLWDAESGVTRGILRGHELPVGGVAFSPDGSRLASIGIGGGTIRVWAVAVDDLVMLARRELTRGLSDEECRQYLHVDACPARWLP